MTLQEPTPPIRSRVSFDEVDGLHVVIPAKSDPRDVVVGAIIVGVALVVALGCVSYRLLVASTRNHDPRGAPVPGWPVAVVIFCVPLSIVGLQAMHAARCREIIHIDGYHITLSSEGYAFRRPRKLPLVKAKNLRYSPVNHGSGRGTQAGESIAFEWWGEAVRFGVGLSEEESRRLIRTIKGYYKIPDDDDQPLPVERL
jgi:hypothetical protein